MICGIVTEEIEECLLEANNWKKFWPALWVHLMCILDCIMTMMRRMMMVVVVVMCINCICYTASNEMGRYSYKVKWIWQVRRNTGLIKALL